MPVRQLDCLPKPCLPYSIVLPNFSDPVELQHHPEDKMGRKEVVGITTYVKCLDRDYGTCLISGQINRDYLPTYKTKRPLIDPNRAWNTGNNRCVEILPVVHSPLWNWTAKLNLFPARFTEVRVRHRFAIHDPH